MRITAVHPKKEITDRHGLQPMNLTKLGKIVVLAGKNGSGKSRFLEMLRELFKSYPTNNDLKFYKHERQSLEARLKEIEKEPNDIMKKMNIDTINSAIAANKLNFESLSNMELSNGAKTEMVNFLPKQVAIADTSAMNSQQIIQSLPDPKKASLDHIGGSSTAFIQNLVLTYIYATHPDTAIQQTPEEKKQSIQNFTAFNEIAIRFLGHPISLDKNGQAAIFGKQLSAAKLSDGQKILLQLCVGIFLYSGNISDLILIMDEPENHMHPAVLLEVIDVIVKNIGDGQLWIATHNINILAHFEPSDILYVNEGEVKYAGNIPDQVLTSLLGNEEEQIKLFNFLQRPDEIAYNQFCFQCIKPPAVLDTGLDDKQVSQAYNIFKENVADGLPLKIIDFGMGQGRVISTIDQLLQQENMKFSDHYDYYGYDIDTTYSEKCQGIFNGIYPGSKTRYYNKSEDLLANHDKGSFDFIMLTNVFHEIHPKDWISLFNTSNSPFKLLKPDGYVLIIEDQVLPIGEQAHSNGFLVFDHLHFKTLFDIKASEGYKVESHPKNPRLKAHYIPAACLTRISSTTRQEAIDSLRLTAIEQLKRIRAIDKPTFQDGRQLAFWSQQLANAALSIEELGNPTPETKS